MGYLVYALMLGIACGVGFGIIQPIFSNTATYGEPPMNGIVFVLIAVVVGVLLNALFVELGHILGAKAGHYTVVSVTILGLQFKRQKNGKFKTGFGDYDGITGETVVYPQDVKKSNPRHLIYMPLLFLLIEVVVLAVLIAVGGAMAKQGVTVMNWWGKVFGTVILAIAGMIYLYDIFPAYLDAKNDGCLLNILTNPTNVEAYNEILLAKEKMNRGEPAGDTPVYDQVTDFTAEVNNITLYARLAKLDYPGALEIIEKTLACKDKVSSSVYSEALAQKTALILLTKPLGEAKEFFIALPLEQKKYIASLENAASIRAYLLASGLVEDSLSETEAALDKADTALKKSGEKKDVEESLLKEAVNKVLAAHADWDLSDYGYGEKKEAATPNQNK